MRRHPPMLNRWFWMMCGCLLLLPHLAAASEPLLATDFDGDGQRDHVVVDRGDPLSVQVWLSATDTTQIIHTHVPLLQVIAADLDGDHRPELIARDSKSHLHVWTRAGDGFHRYRARKTSTRGLQQESHRTVD